VLGWASLFAAGIGGFFIAKSQLNAERREALQKGTRKPPPHIKSWEEIRQEEEMAAQSATQHQQQQSESKK